MVSMEKAIFRSRRVINKSNIIGRKPFAPLSMDELEILDGVRESIIIFKKKFKSIVITNQPDVSKKKLLKKM